MCKLPEQVHSFSPFKDSIPDRQERIQVLLPPVVNYLATLAFCSIGCAATRVYNYATDLIIITILMIIIIIIIVVTIITVTVYDVSPGS